MKFTKSKTSGLTLVELLVAIAILSIVVALIVPRLRLVNKERNIREAARVVGSVFSAARDRAVAEGCAGVIIERNVNFVSQTPDGNQVYFAGTRLAPIRFKAAYSGDFDSDFAMFYRFVPSGGGEEELRGMIPMPLDHDNQSPVIFRGDSIAVGGATYRIRNVFPQPRNIMFQVQEAGVFEEFCGKIYDNDVDMDMLHFRLEWDDNPDHSNPPDNLQLNTDLVDLVTGEPAPRLVGGGDTFQFQEIESLVYCNFAIKRLSLDRLTASQANIVDLPEGYIIDLRYSGPVDNQFMGGMDGDPSTHTVCSLANTTDSLYVLFDEHGSLSEFLFFNGNQLERRLAGTSLFLFINEYDPELIEDDVQQQALALLSGEDNLWLTIGINGGANIGYNVAPQPDNVPVMIDEARTLSRLRTSARQ